MRYIFNGVKFWVCVCVWGGGGVLYAFNPEKLKWLY